MVIECAGVRGFKQGGGVSSQPETKALRAGAGAGAGAGVAGDGRYANREGQDRQRTGGKGRRDSGMCVCMCVCGVSGSVSVCSRVVLQLARLETDVVVFLPPPCFVTRMSWESHFSPNNLDSWPV